MRRCRLSKATSSHLAQLWLDSAKHLLSKRKTPRRRQLAWYCFQIALIWAERAGIDVTELPPDMTSLTGAPARLHESFGICF